MTVKNNWKENRLETVKQEILSPQYIEIVFYYLPKETLKNVKINQLINIWKMLKKKMIKRK